MSAVGLDSENKETRVITGQDVTRVITCQDVTRVITCQDVTRVITGQDVTLVITGQDKKVLYCFKILIENKKPMLIEDDIRSFYFKIEFQVSGKPFCSATRITTSNTYSLISSSYSS